jgi:putative flippase GtrA
LSKFAALLHNPDVRYVTGALVSWPVYGVLYKALLDVFDRHYAASAGLAWMLSYAVVYAFQKYGTFGKLSRGAMLREIALYAVAVVASSGAVNFGLVKLLADYDPTLNKFVAVAAATIPAALVAWFVSTRVLRIGSPG